MTLTENNSVVVAETVSPATLVQLEGVRFRWKPGAPLVLDIEAFTVKKGEKVFLKGPSGSGKSTLLNLVAGVIVPQEGAVTVDDTAVSNLRGARRDAFRADHIGFIFQMFNLIPYLSVLENVTLALTFSKRREARIKAAGTANEEAARLLGRLGLDDTLRKRPVTELSIGQQQRVAAARALIGSPALLIADEPTSALDADTRESFVRLLFEECDRAGMTLLFVSHDGSLEHLFDRSVDLRELNRARGTRPGNATVRSA